MKTAAVLAAASKIPALVRATPLATRPRGIVSAVRAETDTPAAQLAAINTLVTDMRARLDAQGARIDPLDAQTVERINAAITPLQTALDAQAQTIAALRIGGGGGNPGETPEARQASADFQAFMSRGTIPQARGATFSEPDGGFLVPTQIDTNVSRVLSQTVAMRGLARVMTISAAQYKMFKSIGGAASGWVGESDSRTETGTPKLVAMEFVPGELYAEPATTQQLLDDSQVNIETWYGDELAITFAEQEDAAFVIGDGIKKPRGFLDYAQVDNSAYAWGSLGFVKTGAAGGFIARAGEAGPADALIDLFHALRAGYRNGASFIMSDLTTAIVRKFKDGQGNYLWQPSVAVGEPSTLLGKPVAMSDNMPSVAAGNIPIAFGDFNQGYLIVDRIGVRTLRNPYKQNGVVFFYTTKRVGGGVSNFEAIKLLKVSA